MTDPSPPVPPSKRTFFSRRFAPLIAIWIVAFAVAGLIYWFELEMPAFHEVVTPLYAIIGVAALVFTWQWIRTRGRGDRRRRRDRRRADRRESRENPTPPTGL